MDCLWFLAGSIVGLALGLQFGRLLFAILAHWENTETATKCYISIIGFVLGGGAGAVIFRRFCTEYSDAFYAVGLEPNLAQARTADRNKFLLELKHLFEDPCPFHKHRIFGMLCQELLNHFCIRIAVLMK